MIKNMNHLMRKNMVTLNQQIAVKCETYMMAKMKQ